MSSRFDPADWYWSLVGNTTQVYSSKAIALVGIGDATYQQWLALGNVATRIAAEQDLWDLLTEANVSIPAGKATSDASKDRRIAAADAVQFNMLFNHENRIRTLAGQATVTKAQFVTFVKSQMI